MSETPTNPEPKKTSRQPSGTIRSDASGAVAESWQPGSNVPNFKEPAELQQLRAEVAMLRVQVQDAERGRHETADEKRAHKAYLEWICLSAAEKTQLAADTRFAGLPGELWEVSLQEQPTVRLPAHSDYEAIGRYQEICGILGTAHKFTAVKIGVA